MHTVYLDLETTGLDPAHHEILEVGILDDAGEWDTGRDCWHWQKLHVAAAHVGFVWPGAAHRAIHDCAATRAVWHWLQQAGQ